MRTAPEKDKNNARQESYKVCSIESPPGNEYQFSHEISPLFLVCVNSLYFISYIHFSESGVSCCWVGDIDIDYRLIMPINFDTFVE